MAKKKLVQPNTIVTYAQTKYKDCPIVVESLGTVFWYRLSYENELLGAHIEVKPKKDKLNENEMLRAAVYMYDMAMATIDHLRGDDPNEEEIEHKAAAEVFVEAVTGAQHGKN